MAFAAPLLLALATSATSVVAIPQSTPGPTIPPGNTNPVLLFTLSGSDPLASVPGIPAASTSDPVHAVFDGHGELFVGNRFSNDGVNGSISRFLVRPDGTFKPNGTITGNGLQNVHGLAVSAAGELFATNLWAGTISRFGFAADGTPIANGTIATGGWPHGIAFDLGGDMLMVDAKAGNVKRWRFTNGVPVWIARFDVTDASGNRGAGISGAAFSPSGELFVASTDTDRVFRYTFTPNSGIPTASSSFPVSGGPLGLAFGPDGELFVTSHRSGQISRFTFDASGNPIASGAPVATSTLGGIAVHELRDGFVRAPRWVWRNNFGYGQVEEPATGLTTPVLGDAGTVVYGVRAPSGDLVGINPPAPGMANPTRRWVWSTYVGPWAPSLGNDGNLYLTDGYNYIYGLSVDTGGLTWRWGYGNNYMSGTPSIGPDGTFADGYPYGTLYPIWGTQSVVGLSPNPAVAINSFAKLRMGPQSPFADPPTIGADGTLYSVKNATVTARAPDGTTLWTFTVPPSIDPPEWQDVTQGHKYLSIGRDGTIYLTLTYFHTMLPYLFVELYALDPDPAAAVRVKWALSGDSLLGQGDAIGPAIVGPDGAVYQATVEGVFAFDPDSAAPARRIFYPPGGTMTSNPAVGADGTIYVVAPYDDDAAAPGWYSTSLYALDPGGAVKWVTPAAWSDGSAPPASPTSPVIGPDGTVYFGTNDGRLYAVAGDITAAPTGEWPMLLHDAKNTRRGSARAAGVDLVTTTLSSPPATLIPGDVLTVKDTTVNAGAAAGTTATTTRYYLSTDKVRDPLDLLVGGRAVPALPPGGRSTGSATVTVAVPAGAYYLLACADGAGAEAEPDETNNCFAAASWVLVSGPDLVEAAVGNPPATAIAGGSFAVTDTAVNQGTAPARVASVTRFYLSADAVVDAADVVVGSRTVDALLPGASSPGSTTLTIPAMAPGVYRLLACADAGLAVAETDEANNCATAATGVAVTAPDLTVSAVTNPPALAVQGNTFSVTDTVVNGGGAAAAASQTSYHLSLDAQRSGDDTALYGNRAVPALAPGATSGGAVAVRVPSMPLVGQYYLLACADGPGAIAEGDEANNCRASATRVTIGPDLVVSQMNSPPATAAPGATFTMNDRNLNQGSLTTGVASTTRYYLSRDAVRDAADVRLGGSRAVPVLAPNATSNGNVAVTVPATVAPGAYWVLACADDLAAVAEASETNNCRASTTQTRIGPDLTVSSVTFPASSTARRVGSAVAITDGTRNAGTSTTGVATVTRYYLSLDGVKDASDTAIAVTRPVPVLAAGATSSGTVTVALPSVAAGTYRVIACADDNRAVAEALETNNCTASTATMAVSP